MRFFNHKCFSLFFLFHFLLVELSSANDGGLGSNKFSTMIPRVSGDPFILHRKKAIIPYFPYECEETKNLLDRLNSTEVHFKFATCKIVQKLQIDVPELSRRTSPLYWLGFWNRFLEFDPIKKIRTLELKDLTVEFNTRSHNSSFLSGVFERNVSNTKCLPWKTNRKPSFETQTPCAPKYRVPELDVFEIQNFVFSPEKQTRDLESASPSSNQDSPIGYTLVIAGIESHSFHDNYEKKSVYIEVDRWAKRSDQITKTRYSIGNYRPLSETTSQ